MIFPRMDLFLEDYSKRNQKYYALILSRYREYLEKKGLTSLSQVKRIDFKEFCSNWLNKQQWRAETKQKQYEVISLYLKFLKDFELVEKDLRLQKNPHWSDFVTDAAAKKALLPPPSKEDIFNLIRYARPRNPKDKSTYIFLVLIAHNGSRPSEIASIKIENINLEERTITSGVIEGAAKESVCYYFIPRKFVSELNMYIEDLKETYRDPVFLFPGDTKTGYKYTQSFGKNINKYAKALRTKKMISNCKTNLHIFRHALNYERLLLGCNDSIMSILLNQTPKATNAQFYLKQIRANPMIRRQWWDKFTPCYL